MVKNRSSRANLHARTLTSNSSPSLLTYLTAIEAGGQEKTLLSWPRKAVFFASFFYSHCTCSDFLLLSRCQTSLHQTSKRALQQCGAPEDQRFRTGLTQTRRDGRSSPVSYEIPARAELWQMLAEAASQSNATGSAQLGAGDCGLHIFTCRRLTPAGNPPLLSVRDKLPAPACELSRYKLQAFGRCLDAAVDVAGSIV